MSSGNVADIQHIGVIGDEIWHKKEEIMIKLFFTCDGNHKPQIQEI